MDAMSSSSKSETVEMETPKKDEDIGAVGEPLPSAASGETASKKQKRLVDVELFNSLMKYGEETVSLAARCREMAEETRQKMRKIQETVQALDALAQSVRKATEELQQMSASVAADALANHQMAVELCEVARIMLGVESEV